MAKTISKVGVLGSGQMGAGIAQVAAGAGLQVVLADREESIAKAAKAKVEAQLLKLVEKGKFKKEDVEGLVSRITPAQGMESFSSCDLVIEAVSENKELKYKIFSDLDRVCKPDAILASNTSSISITAIAAKTKRPEKVIGMHFMNPVPVMKLIEGIKGLQTSEETISLVKDLSGKMGKVWVEARDFPGFAVNRILMPMINEAVTALYEGVASPIDIDQAMKLGTNQPMGPLELADFIGLDTCLAIMEVLHEGLGDSKYRPSPLLRQYVDAGWFGRKTGRGFHQYGV